MEPRFLSCFERKTELFRLFNVFVRYLCYVDFYVYLVESHDYYELLRIITYCYKRGLQEQAAQKDVKILSLELLCGTHGLCLVPPLELYYCASILVPCYLLCLWRKNKFDLI